MGKNKFPARRVVGVLGAIGSACLLSAAWLFINEVSAIILIVFLAVCLPFFLVLAAAPDDFQEQVSRNHDFSAYRLIGVLGAFALLIGGMSMNHELFNYIDVPSFIITVVVAFFLLLAAYRGEFIRFVPDAFLTFFLTRREPCPRFAKIAGTARRYVWAAGAIGTLIGLVQMFSDCSDPSNLLAGLAVSLITTLYAGIAGEFVCAFLRDAYEESAPAEKPESPQS